MSSGNLLCHLEGLQQGQTAIHQGHMDEDVLGASAEECLAYLDFLEEGLCFLILLKMLAYRHQYLVDCLAEGRLQVTCSCHQI